MTRSPSFISTKTEHSKAPLVGTDTEHSKAPLVGTDTEHSKVPLVGTDTIEPVQVKRGRGRPRKSEEEKKLAEEKAKERLRKYYQEHREEIKQRSQEYYQEHREEMIDKVKQKYREDLEYQTRTKERSKNMAKEYILLKQFVVDHGLWNEFIGK